MLIIFVKNPIKGEVKTRLAAEIGAEKAVEIYQKLLCYTAKIAQEVPHKKVVFYGNEMPATDIWAALGYERQAQVGDDLGERMKNAFEWVFLQGAEKAIIVGSDCAEISAAIIAEAFFALEKHDIVIGEAEDGGYYLLGMKKLFSPIFEDKKWSSSHVFEATILDIKQAKLSYYLLPKLRDIDTFADLQKSPFKQSF